MTVTSKTMLSKLSPMAIRRRNNAQSRVRALYIATAACRRESRRGIPRGVSLPGQLCTGGVARRHSVWADRHTPNGRRRRRRLYFPAHTNNGLQAGGAIGPPLGEYSHALLVFDYLSSTAIERKQFIRWPTPNCALSVFNRVPYKLALSSGWRYVQVGGSQHKVKRQISRVTLSLPTRLP